MLKVFSIFIFLIIFIWILFVEPNTIIVEKLNFNSDDIKNLKIVFVSDFHLNKFDAKRLEKIVNKINEQKPDIVISGGDYAILHNVRLSMDMDKVAKILSKVETKYGFYTVLGNHDYNKDSSYIKDAFKKYNLGVLENSNVEILHNDKSFYVAGISDMQTTFYSLDKALKNTKPPVILVSHSPDIAPLAKGRVDLILSGHTHGGQVRVPFFGAIIVPSKYGKKYQVGLVDKTVYVSRGLGTSILPIRFNCFPEITVVQYN